MIQFRRLLLVLIACATTAGYSFLSAQEAAKPYIKPSPLLKEPKTPEEMFSATLAMLDLVRMDLAVRYLEQFEASQPDDELLLKLRDKYGMGDFIRLSHVKELQPRSTELLERVVQAAKQQADDPEFVAGLVQRLIKEPSRREIVVTELRNLGVNAVPEILKQIALDDSPEHNDVYTTTLIRMGKQIVPPMIGAIDAPVDAIRLTAFNVLAALNAQEAVPYLWYPASEQNFPSGIQSGARTALATLLTGNPVLVDRISSVEASKEIRRIAKLLYRNRYPFALDADGKVEIWGWSQEKNSIVKTAYNPRIASLLMASRFAAQHLALSPESTESQQLYLATLLGLEVAKNGWERPRVPTPDSALYLASTSGPSTVANVLTEALEAGEPGTAVAAIEVLGQIGSREQLSTENGLKSPLIASLNSPDPRVQFAAATTILKLNPDSPFRYSNRVVNILGRAASDPGKPRVLIIDADEIRGNLTSGYVNNAGYEGLVAPTGKEGFELAANSAGIEAVIIHVNCMRWALKQTLANFRADSRTASLPIVIYGPSSLEAELEKLVHRTEPASYVIESSTSADFLDQAVPFLKSVKSPPISNQERELQKSAAVYWLATIGTGNLSRYLDIAQAESELSAAMEDGKVASNAIIALGSISTRSAQRRLTDVAMNASAPDELRVLSADQLVYHIQRHGLLLTNDEVVNFHSIWKQTDDPKVKSALANVIGALKPKATVVSERLRQFPIPPTN